MNKTAAAGDQFRAEDHGRETLNHIRAAKRLSTQAKRQPFKGLEVMAQRQEVEAYLSARNAFRAAAKVLDAREDYIVRSVASVLALYGVNRIILGSGK